MASQFPAQVMQSTSYWLSRFSSDYASDIPQRIHSSSIARDGSPEWHPDFARWLTARDVIDTPNPEVKTPEQRLRTTRALRRLRNEAIREFEVVYRVMVLHERIENTTVWLNERAIRNNIPLPKGRDVHYRQKDAIALVISGIDKMALWY